MARKKEKRRKRRVSLAEGRARAKMRTSLVSFCVFMGQTKGLLQYLALRRDF